MKRLARDPKAVLRTLAAGNFFRRSVACQRLFSVEAEFFAALRADCGALVDDAMARPFTLGENRTRPYGEAVQLSLLNRSGRLDDTSGEHDHSRAGKRFHYADRCPALARLIATFPQAYNMRINVMASGSGLSPHKEATLHRGQQGTYYLRARFHLPIKTNADAKVLIGRSVYHFEEGQIYFFHNGMVHSAANEETTPRHHLVWDMLLSRAAVDLMFGSAQVPDFLERIPEAGCEVIPVGSHSGRAFEIVDGFRSESLYRKLRLASLGIADHQFCIWYLRASSLRPRRIAYAQDGDS